MSELVNGERRGRGWPKGVRRTVDKPCPCGGGIAQYRVRVNLYRMGAGCKRGQLSQTYGRSFMVCDHCLSDLATPHLCPPEHRVTRGLHNSTFEGWQKQSKKGETVVAA